MSLFTKNNILIRGLLSDTYSYMQRVYGQTRNVFTVASAWGQILFVLENLSQLILYFIEDSITELNINQATRDYSVISLARISGYDPARVMAAQGQVSVSWNGNPLSTGGGAILIPQNVRMQCQTNGLTYTLLLNVNRLRFNLTKETLLDFKVVQGIFTEVSLTGTGAPLQSFNIPEKNGKFIDHFIIEVYVNDQKWERFDSLYDIPLGRPGYIVKSGISPGIDLYFGNGNFGAIPQAGSIIRVKYLENVGFLGNLKSKKESPISYRFIDSGTDLFGNPINLDDYLSITNKIDPYFGVDPESIETTRIAAPKMSRSFVFANSSNYEIFLRRFNIFSQVEAFSTFDDAYLDDDNVVYLFLVPDITLGITSNQDYFSIPVQDFFFTDSQKVSILNLIQDSGSMVATTVVKILEPEIRRYVANCVVSIFEGYDPDVIKDSIRNMVSDYFLGMKRRDIIPRSDLIALIESIEGIDSVSFYFSGQQNEEYHASVDNLSTLTPEQANKKIGLNSFGDITIKKGELVLIRGGWSDRYGTYYEDGVIEGKPSALNISVSSIVPQSVNSLLNSENKSRLIENAK